MLCQKEEREAGRAYPRTCPTCRLGPCQKFSETPLQTLADTQAAIARLTAERDAALAQAATAAMEMRERAAVRCYEDQGRFDTPDRIRALPIDPDAQRALDEMLMEAEQRGYANAMEAERKDADRRISKAREDAIREASKVAIKQAYDGDHSTAKAIRALLNDGGRDE